MVQYYSDPNLFTYVETSFEIVCDKSDIDNNSNTFHPEFAHVFFGDDERIEGYNQPKLKLYFNAYTFESFLHFAYKKKHPVLPETKFLPQLYQSLSPNSYTSNLQHFMDKFDQSREKAKPFGTFLHEYTKVANPDKAYQIYHHQFCHENGDSDEEFIEFHRRMQFFILLEIDGGTYIESDDPRWEVFLLYEKNKQLGENQDYHLIGYCTAYRFYSHPESFRLRISQFLLFPPYQKIGHGRKLLQSIYDNALSRNARDVPVEDPAPEFTRLRGIF